MSNEILDLNSDRGQPPSRRPLKPYPEGNPDLPTVETSRPYPDRPKYRILEMGGKFYPQVRKSWFLFSWWENIEGELNPNDPNEDSPRRIIRESHDGGPYDYTLFIEYAKTRIDDHAKRTAKPKPRTIIHDYTPKQ